MLLAKCTTAVVAIAKGKGKNKAKIGINTVPSPNPEKRVMIEVIKTVRQIMKYSKSNPSLCLITKPFFLKIVLQNHHFRHLYFYQDPITMKIRVCGGGSGFWGRRLHEGHLLSAEVLQLQPNLSL